MKKSPISLTIKIGIPVLLVVFLLSSFGTAESPKDREVFLSNIVVKALDYWHYSPVQLNDEFSKKAFDNYLKSIDPNKRFFLKSDIKRLSAYQLKIDDDLKVGRVPLLDLSVQILNQRINEVKNMSLEILKQPFDYTKDEFFEIDPKKRDYAANRNEQHQLLSQWLKYQTINTYLDLLKAEKKSLERHDLQKINAKLEAQARQKVANNVKSSLTRLLQEKREIQFDRYLNAIISIYDPHSAYFAPKQKEQFEINMTGKLEGIGAMLKEEGEYVKVEQIVPGSASWRQKELKEGDLILKVAEGKGEFVDISNMRLDDVVNLIRGKKGTTVRLQVKSPDGQIKEISIVRDVVVIEEAYAKSAVIESQKLGSKFGYIMLPSFYHDFNDKKGRNSSGDVRKELLKLNGQKVEGIILDLRNNGGGALEDAIRMAGLFIKSGPVVQVKDSTGKIQVLRDTDPSILSEVPLVILINSVSASASEIVSAALQDYGRAVIVGSPSTFGKGTVQSLFDLDMLVSNKYAKWKPFGTLKLTTQKYYRINGGSVQYKGVISNITLPDSTGILQYGEKYLDHSMPWDTIKSSLYQKWNKQLDIEKLRKSSTQRINSNQNFQTIESILAKIKQENDKTRQSLKLVNYWQDQSLLQNETKKLEQVRSQQRYNVIPMETGIEQKRVQEWMEQIEKDIYIEEAMNVLNDILR